nr:hypothetical protein BaRGS_034058 [Batillaria attramentaria]
MLALGQQKEDNGSHLVQRKGTSDPTQGDSPGEGKTETVEADVEVGVTGVAMLRSLGLIGGSSIIVGTIIGSGIFVSPRGVLESTGSVALSLIVWILAGVISLLGALCYSELGTLMGKSGGEYQYLKEAFGGVVAFLFAWTSVIVIRPSSLAIMSLTFAEYTSSLFDMCVAVGYTSVLDEGFEGTIENPATISLAFYSALWAYDGWNLPRANVLAVILVTTVYAFTNVSYLSVMTTDEVLTVPAVAVVVVALLMIIPGDIGSLIDFFSFTAWLFYGLTFTSLIVFRFRTKWRDARRAYKVPLPIPIVMVLVSVYLLVAPIVDDPQIQFLYAAIFIVGGLIYYLPFVHFKIHFKISG